MVELQTKVINFSQPSLNFERQTIKSNNEANIRGIKYQKNHQMSFLPLIDYLLLPIEYSLLFLLITFLLPSYIIVTGVTAID